MKTLKASLMVLCLALAAVLTPSAQAQTYEVIRNFGEILSDGSYPMAGLAMDAAGNLYGTTSGSVFKLSPRGGNWVFTTLHLFEGGSDDGQFAQAPVVFGPDGALYGTTVYGGLFGYGIVYSLRPPATACSTVLCPWTLSVLYNFNSDIAWYPLGALFFDAAGNIYGTTSAGGYNYGVLYKLSPSNGSWTFTTLHTFAKDGTEGRP